LTFDAAGGVLPVVNLLHISQMFSFGIDGLALT